VHPARTYPGYSPHTRTHSICLAHTLSASLPLSFSQAFKKEQARKTKAEKASAKLEAKPATTAFERSEARN